MLETELWQDIRQAPAEGKQGHNLGAQIIAVAISDMRTGSCQTSRNAEAFLYPQSPQAVEHFTWVMDLMPKVNPAWLRHQLDAWRIRLTPERMCVGEVKCTVCLARSKHALNMKRYQRNRRVQVAS